MHKNQTPGDSGFDNRRISIKDARRILGMLSRNYGDDDMQEVLDVLYGLAEEGYEIYLDPPQDRTDSDEHGLP